MTAGEETRGRPYEELARRLCCAFVSYNLGMSYETCRKQYLSSPIGEYWQDLAERVVDDVSAGRMKVS